MGLRFECLGNLAERRSQECATSSCRPNDLPDGLGVAPESSDFFHAQSLQKFRPSVAGCMDSLLVAVLREWQHRRLLLRSRSE